MQLFRYNSPINIQENRLKKILLFLLITSALYSEAKIYMGASYGGYNESFSDEGLKTNNNPLVKFKVGYGVREAYSVEFSVDYTQVDANSTDVNRYGLNVDLVKAFDFPYVNPFFKAGFGTGYVETASSDKLTFGSFNLGAGIYIPINEHVDIEAGYDYRNLSYERVDDTSKITSHVNIVYAGLNVRF
jgi:opacity protein-like surface antigen